MAFARMPLDNQTSATCAVACFVLAMLLALPASLAAAPRYAAMVIDANTGKVLHDSAGDQPRHPASLTKMMTLYLVFEQIEQGNLKYDTKIKVSDKAAAVAPSKLDLEPGEEISLGDAIKALITKSANDVAVAIAEHIAGTEVRFAELMTKRAHEIGMAHTTFKNASGLPDDNQVTTARDMLTLALHLQDDFPKQYKLFSTVSFTYAGSTFRNHNTLLRTFSGTDGIKTGYTRDSGFNLVSSVHRGGKHVVGAVFGGHTATIRNANMRLLLTKALEDASAEKTRKPTLVARAAPIPRPAAKPPAIAKKEAPTKPAAVSVAAADPPKATAEAETPQITSKSTSTVSLAKVHRVLVTPHVASATAPRESNDEDAPAKPAEATPPVFAQAGAAAPPVLTPVAAVAPAGPPAGSPPAPPLSAPSANALTGPARAPSTFEQQMAALAANVSLEARAESAAAPPATPPLSSANEPVQQAVLMGPPRPPAAEPKVKKPAAKPAAPPPAPGAPAATASLRGTHQIQIGAYASAADAERQLASAHQRSGALLDGRQPVTQPVPRGTQMLYRARYGGFDAVAAASACAELQKLDIGCFVMKAE